MNYIHELYKSVFTSEELIDLNTVNIDSESIGSKAAFFHGKFDNKQNLLVTIGDSYTWGQDLPPKQRIDYVFGNNLAQALDTDWLNVAQVGASNSWILRYADQVIDLLATDTQYKKIYVVVTLTETGRELGLDCEYSPDWQQYNVRDQSLYDQILADLELSWCQKIAKLKQKLDSRYWFYVGQNFAWHTKIFEQCLESNIHTSNYNWVELIFRERGLEIPFRADIVTQFAFHEFDEVNKKLKLSDLSMYKQWCLYKLDRANSVLDWIANNGGLHPNPRRLHPYIDGHLVWCRHILNKTITDDFY